MKKINLWITLAFFAAAILLLSLSTEPLWAYGERIANSFNSITNWVLDVIVPVIALGAMIYFCFRLFTGDHTAFVGIIIVIVALVLIYTAGDLVNMVKGFAKG